MVRQIFRHMFGSPRPAAANRTISTAVRTAADFTPERGTPVVRNKKGRSTPPAPRTRRRAKASARRRRKEVGRLQRKRRRSGRNARTGA